MKISIKTVALLLASGYIISCNSDSTTSTSNTDSTTVKTDTTSTMMKDTTVNNNGDQDIVNDLVTSNTKEIAWLNAGISKGSNKELKSHASMMLKDHKQLGSDVNGIIAKKNLTTPTLPDTTNEVTINDKSGKDWNKAWVDKMVKDHSDLLDKLNKYEGDAKDADLKAAVTKAKPVVQSHLDMAKALQDKMK